MLVRHGIDRLGRASSASSESRSLELLLSLDALVGATILRRTDECSRTARARCAPSPTLQMCTLAGMSCAQLESGALPLQLRLSVAAFARGDIAIRTLYVGWPRDCGVWASILRAVHSERSQRYVPGVWVT